MELQNHISKGKTVRISETAMLEKRPSVEEQHNVQRIRTLLLFVIAILLILCLVNFALVVHTHIHLKSTDSQPSTSSSQIVSILISLFYYAFGFFVTYRYSQTGLLVFAWLGFISLLLMLIILVIILIEILATISYIGYSNALIGTIIFIVLCFTATILQIFTVWYALILSKLLRNNKRLPSEQILI